MEESELQAKLDSMGEEIKVHCSALEAAVAQIDRLQEVCANLSDKMRKKCSLSFTTISTHTNIYYDRHSISMAKKEIACLNLLTK